MSGSVPRMTLKSHPACLHSGFSFAALFRSRRRSAPFRGDENTIRHELPGQFMPRVLAFKALHSEPSLRQPTHDFPRPFDRDPAVVDLRIVFVVPKIDRPRGRREGVVRPPPAKDLVAEGAKQVQGPRLREHPLRGHQARPLQDLEPLPRDVKVWRQGPETAFRASKNRK